MRAARARARGRGGAQFTGGCTFIDFGLTLFGPALGDVSSIIAGGMPIEARRQHEQTLVHQYHACLVEFGVASYPLEQCWRDYQFQIFKPVIQLLVMAPGFARQRVNREGVFAKKRTEADRKLAEMYVALCSRLSTALMDHKWAERVEELPITAGRLRPCC